MKRNLFLLIALLLFTACDQAVDLAANSDVANNELVQETENPSEEIEKESTANEDNDKENNEAKNTELVLHDDLEVHYIDANQADATLFQYTDEDNEAYTILYDTGDWNRNDVINYLAAREISSIDLIIVSHPHADHNGQLAEIVNTYDVGEVWLSGNTASSNTFQRSIEAVMDSDADYYEPRAGEIFDIGPLSIEVLHPSELTGNLNEDSISLLITYGNIKFVFTGDAYKNEEIIMSKHTDIEAHFLQLGHHGSNTSSDPAFLQAVNPDVAIYSAGANNSYGHPSPEVISLILDSGIDLYGTDIHGTIVVTTDGNDYTISTKEDGTISPASTGASKQSKKKEVKKEKEKKLSSKDCVDLNNALLEQLETIIHIGEKRAELIVEQRPFHSVDDLTKIDGIGPARIDDIKSEGIACVK